MYALLEVLEEFYNIFGPELKSVTGDPKRIEDVVKRVDALVRPIEEVSDNELTQNSIIDTNTIYSLKWLKTYQFFKLKYLTKWAPITNYISNFMTHNLVLNLLETVYIQA